MELMFELGLEHRKGRKAIQGSSLCSLCHFVLMGYAQGLALKPSIA